MSLKPVRSASQRNTSLRESWDFTAETSPIKKHVPVNIEVCDIYICNLVVYYTIVVFSQPRILCYSLIIQLCHISSVERTLDMRVKGPGFNPCSWQDT